MTNQRAIPLLVLSLALAAAGCGPVLKHMSVASVTEIFRDGMAAFYREDDLIVAEQGLASTLKLLEVFLEASPDNQDLLLRASQGFGTYAFAFVEDKIARHAGDPRLLDVHRERARRLYLRGRDFGLRALNLRHAPLAPSPSADLSAWREGLAGLGKEDVPALFWAAYGWAGSIHWGLDRPEMLADIPRVMAMMERVLELDEAYFFAGAHLFFGAYHASRSPALGGDPARAKAHLDRALELGGPRILLADLVLADPYAIQTQDRGLFETQLHRILKAPDDLSPDYRLLNEVVKARARRLLERMDELFL